MRQFTYRPALLVKEITLTLEAGKLSRDGHWSLDLADVIRIRRSFTSVRLSRFEDVHLYLRDGTSRRPGISLPKGGSDAEVVYGDMVNALLAAVDPETPVQFGNQTGVRLGDDTAGAGLSGPGHRDLRA